MQHAVVRALKLEEQLVEPRIAELMKPLLENEMG
jgi:hypothetical protein